MFVRSILVIFGMAVLMGSWGGCRESISGGRQAVKVRGTVEFDGKPLELGEIMFVSDNQEHRAFSAQIQQGTYSALVEAGPYQVQITAMREVPGKFEELPGPDGTVKRWPAQEMYLPAKYNSRTELKVTIQPEAVDDVSFSLVP